MFTKPTQATINYDSYKTEETELILFYKGLCPVGGVDLDELLAKDITIEENNNDFYETITNPTLFSYFFPLPNQTEQPKFTPLCVEVFQKDNQIIYNYFSVVERVLYYFGFNYLDYTGVCYRNVMNPEYKKTFEQICESVKMIYKDKIEEHKLSSFFKPIYAYTQIVGKEYEKGYLPKQILSNVSRK